MDSVTMQVSTHRIAYVIPQALTHQGMVVFCRGRSSKGRLLNTKEYVY
jgi:hypothetical protein